MQLDELREAWAAHGALLERSLAIDERLLREIQMRKVRFALWPFAVWRALEVAIGVAAMLVVLPVLVAHISEPRYLVAGGALAVYAGWITALCAYLFVRALQLDYDGPVVAIQRDVERVKLVEYRAFKWALLGGVVVWLPALLVLFEAVTGVDALARVDLAYLAGNLVFGLVTLAAAQWWSKRYVERTDLSPWGRRVVDALSGKQLQAATEHLAELARFTREDPRGAGR